MLDGPHPWHRREAGGLRTRNFIELTRLQIGGAPAVSSPGRATGRALLSVGMATMDGPDPRKLAWEALCAYELTGTVKNTLTNGDLVIESDLNLFHPKVDGPFSELYGGVPGAPFARHDRVAFRLKPSWGGWNGTTPRLPAPVKTDTVRRVDPDEPLPSFAELQQLLAGVVSGEEIEHALRAAEARLAEAEDQRDRAIADAREKVAMVDSEAEARVAAVEERIRALEQEQREARAALERDQAEFETKGGRRFLDAIAASEPPARSSLELARPPDVVAALRESAQTAGLTVDSGLLRRTLVAHAVAALTGQLIVYGGPPGSGKTAMSTWMPTVLDMDVDVLPVRPAWLDAADLLGFFDPREKRFVPAPFLDFVLDARRSAAGGLLCVVVLDEMNIARIENYGADLLSQLEKAHQPGQSGLLHLYSPTIQAERDRALIAALDAGSEARLFDPITADVALPANLILAGTLNNDDTTETLSPKVLDRSLGIRVRAQEPALPGQGSPDQERVFSFDSRIAAGLRDLAPARSDEAALAWSQLQALLAGVDVPSVHASHRLARVFTFVPGISAVLGLDVNEVMDDLVCLKVLPWIRFFRGSNRGALDDLETLSKRAHDGGLASTDAEIADLLATDDELVQYLR